MSPRPGGESDKFGNRYEGAWTVRHVLACLEGQGASITVEDLGDIAKGVEFTYRRSDGTVEVHQVKRQSSGNNYWSVAALKALDIWKIAQGHVAQGREYHFVSTLPVGVLDDLSDRVHRAADVNGLMSGSDWLTSKALHDAFDEIAQILGSTQAAFDVLKGMHFRISDERSIRDVNSMLAELLLTGGVGKLAAAGLADLVSDNLGVALTADSIVDELSEYGLSRATAAQVTSVSAKVEAITSNWTSSVGDELLSPPIDRPEATVLADAVADQSRPDRVHFLVGAAGGGKSASLAQAVRRLQDAGSHVLAFRLDRLDPFGSTEEIGTRLGLSLSPVAALAASAGGAPAVLVVDQLDAVSLASGRMPTNFDAVADLVREAATFPNIRVVLSCRAFDVENDHRIRSLASAVKATTTTVGPLTDEQVQAAVSAMDLDAQRLKSNQRELLRTPLHLVLLSTVAGNADALDFTTTNELFDAYWNEKRRAVRHRRRDTRFNEVIGVVASEVSARQRLSVPEVVLDRSDLGDDAEVLISEHLLIKDRGDIAFFHEAFFDYAFARQWIAKGELLVTFLTSSEQELFRRAQVRQILGYLRQLEPDRFVTELRALIDSPDIRFHIKDLALAVAGSLQQPTSAEATTLVQLALAHPDLAERIWQRMRTADWYLRLDADGVIDGWLTSGDEDLEGRAITLMGIAARDVPDAVAAILAKHTAHPRYQSWIRWVARVGNPEASRALFDLYLDAVRSRAFDGFKDMLWTAAHKLADRQPGWAIELLKAHLVEGSDPYAVDEHGKIAKLSEREYAAGELIKKASSALPAEFIQALLPYMVRVMQATELPTNGGYPPDKHFTRYFQGASPDPKIEEALIDSMSAAIRNLAANDPEAARPHLERLATTKRDAAQRLLFEGLIGGAATFASWAVELLQEDTDRLISGYDSSPSGGTAGLIKAITPYLTDDQHLLIEELVREVRFDWESAKGAGLTAFTLLSALDADRLSSDGRRRLGEYQRRFGTDVPPRGGVMVSGTIESPIPAAAAPHMTDENWLRAMTQHDTDETNWDTFKGGARELAHMLQEQVKQNPLRFARLALRLTPEVNPAYADAILLGLAEAPVPAEDQDAIFAAIRHIASLGHSQNDRWLGHGLRRYLETTPIDLVEILAKRAGASPNPTSDGEVVTSSNRSMGDDLRMNGINSVRGALSEVLGDLLIYDSDGSRTTAVMPYLSQLANDRVLAVRSCVAHLIAAALRTARPEAVAIFHQLVNADDALLTTNTVRDLIAYIGNRNPDEVLSVIERMVNSDQEEVREAGGEMAAFAALEWERPGMLELALSRGPSARTGAARMCAMRLPRTSNVELAATTLTRLFDDEDDRVRKAAAEVAVVLRGQALTPFAAVLTDLVASPAYTDATPQLFFTLEQAPDRVDDLARLCARRFVDVYGPDASDIRTAAAGDAQHVSDLLLRALAQSRDAEERSQLLDLIDDMLRVGAYGIDDAIDSAER